MSASTKESSITRMRNAFRRWPLSLKVVALCGLWLLVCLPFLGLLGGSGAAVVMGLPAAVGVLSFLGYRGYHPSTIAVVALTMGVYACYVGYTSHVERNFDVEHQVKYILYIVQHGKAPPSSYCFICHHPPLYYASSAAVYTVSALSGFATPLRAVQVLSLVCVLSFCICSAATMRRLTHNPWIVSLGCALASLWPYTIIHSARIHNDVMALALMAWTIYACLRYYQTPSRRWLLGAVALAALSVMTKTNGYVVVALVCVTVFARFWWPDTRPEARKAMMRFAIPVCLVMVVGLGTFARNRGAEPQVAAKAQDKAMAQAPDNDAPQMTERLLGSAAKIGQRAWMHNEPYNYMYFDLREFLEQPYIMAHVDNVGRQLYLNHLLKSSLFSTHNEHPDAETSYRINRRLASLLNFLLLMLCGFVLYVALGATKAGVRRNFVLVAAFFGFLAGGVAFRALVPHTHHSDFRHIFPILLPFCVAFALGVEDFSRRKSFMATVGLGLAGSFLFVTLLYFAPKYQWIQANSPVKWTDKYASAMRRWVKAGTNWNEKGNVMLEGTDGLRVKFSDKPRVQNFAISLDNNDKYQITVVGERESRTVEVGPHPDKKSGMAEYVQQVSPPIDAVKEILVRPLLGDHAYSVGHVVVNHGIVTEAKKPTGPSGVFSKPGVPPAAEAKGAVKPPLGAGGVGNPAKPGAIKPAAGPGAGAKAGGAAKPDAGAKPGGAAKSGVGAKAGAGAGPRGGAKPGAERKPGAAKQPSRPGEGDKVGANTLRAKRRKARLAARRAKRKARGVERKKQREQAGQKAR